MVLSWGSAEWRYHRCRRGPDPTMMANYLPSAGVFAFDKVDPSLALITDFPTIGDDGRSATFVWSSFYPRLPDGKSGEQWCVRHARFRRMSSVPRHSRPDRTRQRPATRWSMPSRTRTRQRSASPLRTSGTPALTRISCRAIRACTCPAARTRSLPMHSGPNLTLERNTGLQLGPDPVG